MRHIGSTLIGALLALTAGCAADESIDTTTAHEKAAPSRTDAWRLYNSHLVGVHVLVPPQFLAKKLNKKGTDVLFGQTDVPAVGHLLVRRGRHYTTISAQFRSCRDQLKLVSGSITEKRRTRDGYLCEGTTIDGGSHIEAGTITSSGFAVVIWEVAPEQSGLLSDARRSAKSLLN